MDVDVRTSASWSFCNDCDEIWSNFFKRNDIQRKLVDVQEESIKNITTKLGNGETIPRKIELSINSINEEWEKQKQYTSMPHCFNIDCGVIVSSIFNNEMSEKQRNSVKVSYHKKLQWGNSINHDIVFSFNPSKI